MDLQRPLALLVHADESAPVAVALLLHVPVAVTEGDHLGGVLHRGLLGLAPHRIPEVHAEPGVGRLPGEGAPDIVAVAHEEGAAGPQAHLVPEVAQLGRGAAAELGDPLRLPWGGGAVEDLGVRSAVHGTAEQGRPDPGRAVGAVDAHRIDPMVHDVGHGGEAYLPQVADAFHAVGLGLRLRESRQEHPGQDGDDGDDHQEFDQGESGGTVGAVTGPWVQGFRMHGTRGEDLPGNGISLAPVGHPRKGNPPMGLPSAIDRRQRGWTAASLGSRHLNPIVRQRESPCLPCDPRKRRSNPAEPFQDCTSPPWIAVSGQPPQPVRAIQSSCNPSPPGFPAAGPLH